MSECENILEDLTHHMIVAARDAVQGPLSAQSSGNMLNYSKQMLSRLSRSVQKYY